MEQLLCLEEPKMEEEQKSPGPRQQLGNKIDLDGFSYDCTTLNINQSLTPTPLYEEYVI